MGNGIVSDDIDGTTVAKRAGVVYLPDARPGIRRRKCGSGFTYVDERGRRVERDLRQRIESLAVPPAWTDVWVAPEPDAHLLATGFDADGRKQYLYHPAWTEAANAAKFDRIARFAEPLAALRAQVADELRRPRSDDWVCAAVVRLIDASLIRPGSFRHFAAKGSVGATTLHAEHVSVSRRQVHLHFTGKGAIEHEVVVDDPLLARRISDLLDRSDDAAPIFADDAGALVGGERLNAYIARHAGQGFTAKDLRTWGATAFAGGLLARARVVVGGDGDPDELVRESIRLTAERLGNTVAVCRASYVAPTVVEAFHSGELAESWRRSRRARWLSRDERTVGRVLSGRANGS